MSLIEIGKLQGLPDDLIEQQIIKEFLIKESDKIYREINKETANAEQKGVPPHIISIFKYKLEERRNFLQHLLNLAITNYWDIEKKEKK